LFEDKIITGDHPDIKQGKPAPDIFLAAAKKLNVDPKKCIVFEDSPSGVQAGRAAGMFVGKYWNNT
jgi:HAD superfamily hydrolase (TIGR01509 family)